jgi:DASH complex subunit DAD3
MTSTPSTSAPEFTPSSSTNTGADTLSPLEQEVLDEYTKLLGNLNNVSALFFQDFECGAKQSIQLTSLISELAANPSAEILDALRGLERKTSLVFTLLKASVYSIVLQQQIGEEEVGQSTSTKGDGT